MSKKEKGEIYLLKIERKKLNLNRWIFSTCLNIIQWEHEKHHIGFHYVCILCFYL